MPLPPAAPRRNAAGSGSPAAGSPAAGADTDPGPGGTGALAGAAALTDAGDLAGAGDPRRGNPNPPGYERSMFSGPVTDSLPPGSGQQATNHTMIVPTGAGDFDDDGGYRRPRRARRSRHTGEPWLQRWLFSRRILAVLAVILVAIGAWWFADGQYSAVPSVAGMSVSTARGDLTNAGLHVVTGTGRHSDTVPAGQVISTDPSAGARITHDGSVTIIPSLGPVLVTVPSVTGMTLAQAEHALKAAGLTFGQPTGQTSTSIPSGVVISTNPVAYQHWPENKPVSIVVSDGAPLPNFVGQQFSAAQATAAAGGYSLNQVTVSNSSQPAGTIIRQSPAASTPITSPEVVTVWVSAGPPEVAVPDVQGMTVGQADAALSAAGFQVSENQVTPGSKVISYSPTGQAPQGSTITIVVGFF
jgi:serine/threonine-protein kinase